MTSEPFYITTDNGDWKDLKGTLFTFKYNFSFIL